MGGLHGAASKTRPDELGDVVPHLRPEKGFAQLRFGASDAEVGTCGAVEVVDEETPGVAEGSRR